MARKLAILALLLALSASLSLLSGRPVSASEPARFSGFGPPALAFETALAAKPGDLDSTFDADGKLTTDFGGTDEADGVAMQPDGKIVAAGFSQDTLTFDVHFVLARYNANGSLDSSFGSGGKVRTDFGGTWDAGFAVAIQPDGKIVAAGNAFNVPGVTYYTDFALARYNPDGSLDATFGTNGKVMTNLQRTESAFGVAIQPDGKIVAVGNSRATATVGGYDFAVARYNANGSLDSSFGGSGFVITPFSQGWDEAEAVIVQPDGKIVAVGGATGDSPNTQHLALARYSPDGTLDAGFGTGGKVEGQPGGFGWSVAAQSDGKLVVGTGDIARYNANGSPDSSFGSNGKVDLAGDSSARIVLVQPDRKLVVAGQFFQNPNVDFLVARLQPDGSEDSSFGVAGQAHTDIGTNSYDVVYAAVLQSDRRIVVAGRTQPTSETGPVDFALVRYLNPAPVICKVPNVRGKKLPVARSAITKARCSVGKVKRQASKKVKGGRVISQSPKAGKSLPNRSKVNLVVSRGRKR